MGMCARLRRDPDGSAACDPTVPAVSGIGEAPSRSGVVPRLVRQSLADAIGSDLDGVTPPGALPVAGNGFCAAAGARAVLGAQQRASRPADRAKSIRSRPKSGPERLPAPISRAGRSSRPRCRRGMAKHKRRRRGGDKIRVDQKIGPACVGGPHPQPRCCRSLSSSNRSTGPTCRLRRRLRAPQGGGERAARP